MNNIADYIFGRKEIGGKWYEFQHNGTYEAIAVEGGIESTGHWKLVPFDKGLQLITSPQIKDGDLFIVVALVPEEKISDMDILSVL